MRVRCADGPYVGQTFDVPYTKQIHYLDRSDLYTRVRAIGPLVWIIYGGDKHCYQLVSNGWYDEWRLIYRDTF